MFSKLKDAGVKFKAFANEVAPFPENLAAGLMKPTRADKIAVAAAGTGLYGAAGAGLIYGATQEEEGSTLKYGDIGFQVGGLLGAGAMVGSPMMRKMFGGVKLAGMAGGAITTMTTSVMQDDDTGFLQRTGVMMGSLAVGTFAGGYLGKKAISRFSKPIK
jgi:hypothetical protein